MPFLRVTGVIFSRFIKQTNILLSGVYPENTQKPLVTVTTTTKSLIEIKQKTVFMFYIKCH